MSILIPDRDQSKAPFKSKLQGENNDNDNYNYNKNKKHSNIYLNPKNKSISPAGNRTPVSRVTGGDTHHYTTEELDVLVLMGYLMGKHPFSL